MVAAKFVILFLILILFWGFMPKLFAFVYNYSLQQEEDYLDSKTKKRKRKKKK